MNNFSDPSPGIKAIIPSDNVAERVYIMEELFTNFLGLPLNIELSEGNQESYAFYLPNGSTLIVEDHFFSKYKEPLSYLKAEHIPGPPQKLTHHFFPEKELPVLFGEPLVRYSEKSIHCALDLFASCFFMLSRWEEYVIKDKDTFQRFDGSKAHCRLHSYHNRPVVDEWTQGLKNMLLFLDPTLKIKKHVFKKKITCDVDFFTYPYVRNFVKNLVLYRNFSEAQRIIRWNFKKEDPYFEGLKKVLDINEKYGQKVAFYFIPYCTSLLKDSLHFFSRKKVLSILSELQSRGHEIGIHPGFYTYNNPENFARSVNAFHKMAGSIIGSQPHVGGRQHYLRWEFPTTLRLWEEHGLHYDSTLGFADTSGFRCGTCRPYYLFDVVRQRKTSLLEYPLIVMETTVFDFSTRKKNSNRNNFSQNFEWIMQLKNTCNKYDGVFTLLWHNSNLVAPEYVQLYEEVVKN